MSHHLIIGNLKKLLPCTRRKVINSPLTSTPTTHSECCGASSESTRCQPLQAFSSRRRRARRLANNSRGLCYGQVEDEVSESLQTLCSGSTKVEVSAEAPDYVQVSPAVMVGATDSASRATDAVGQVRGPRHCCHGCQAQICHMENCDHCSQVKDATVESYICARRDDLVITEHLPESLNPNWRQRVVNNALINYQRQMSSELCDDDCHHSSSVLFHPSEALHVSTNLSNVTWHQPGSCTASHQTACQRSAQRVKLLSDESEPRATTCASVSTSEQPGCDPLAGDCWGDGDADKPGAAPEASPAAEARTKRSKPTVEGAGTGSVGQSYDNPKLAFVRAGTCGESRDRYGTLSGDWCLSLCQTADTDLLLKRYLEKREITEATRTRHSQRCGSINAGLMHRILSEASAARAWAATNSQTATTPAASAVTAEAAGSAAYRRRRARLTADQWSRILANLDSWRREHQQQQQQQQQPQPT